MDYGFPKTFLILVQMAIGFGGHTPYSYVIQQAIDTSVNSLVADKNK